MIITLSIAIAVLLINIPFGFWRGSTKKLTLAWFVSIHLPVIISIFLRHVNGIEFQLFNIILFVSVFFLGQFSGKLLYTKVCALNLENKLCCICKKFH